MSAEPEMKVSREDLAAFHVPLSCRDYCAHVLIPLNECRKKSAYAPWKCEEERHAYEVCQYKEYVRRREMKKDGVM